MSFAEGRKFCLHSAGYRGRLLRIFTLCCVVTRERTNHSLQKPVSSVLAMLNVGLIKLMKIRTTTLNPFHQMS